MKRSFTFLIAAMALMIAMMGPCATTWGQTETDEVYKTALFGSSYNSEEVSGYTNSWYATNNGFRVDLVNFNNNNNGWNYVKCGSKNSTSVATITTNATIDKVVTKVTITIDAITASKVNSIKLYSGTTESSITTLEGEFTKSTGEQTVTISSLNQATNKFYKIEFDCQKGSSNGLITISKVEYYKEKILKVETPTFNPAAGEYVGTQNVTISTETEDATIYYNFTGVEPWNNYTGSVAVSETSTLYAYATKTDYEDSEIASAAYIISSSMTLDAPTLTVTPGNAKVTPTWAAVPNASSYTIEYATDDVFTNPTSIANAVSGTEITGLTNETQYYFRIKSIGDGVTYMSSEWSATVSATPSSLTTMAIDFESASNTYTDWTFTNMTSQQTNITAHGGSYIGTTGGKESASITTKNTISNPQTFTCYVSKASGNTTSSYWKIQISHDGTSWTDVKSQSASSMNQGVWVKLTQDLSSYHNVYVRIYYDGSTAVRTIDDLTLTYAPAEYKTLAVANIDNGTISAAIGTTTVTEGNSTDNALVNATVTLTQESETGYTFDEWDVYKTGESSTKVTVTNNSFEMPNFDVTVSASFSLIQTYSITISDQISNGNVTSNKSIAAAGETVTLSATPNTGYMFASWDVTYIDGESQSQNVTVTNNSFTMPAFPVTVHATFTIIPPFSSIDLSEKTYSLVSEEQVVWENAMVNMTVNKAEATTPANNYLPPAQSSSRLYKNSTLELTPASEAVRIEYYEFIATTNGYATAFAGSNWTNATANANANETNVTITPTEKTNAISATIGGTCGFTEVKIHYTLIGDFDIDENTVVNKLTIPNDIMVTVIENKSLTVTESLVNNGNEYNLLINDGAQLIHSNAGLQATVKKSITGYGYGEGNYYFIAAPMASAVSTSGIATGTYDLYAYDEEQALWLNAKQEGSTFNTLNPQQGYLYANNATQEVSMAGTLNPSNEAMSYNLSFARATDDFKGFNLVGNPFACNASVNGSNSNAFYKMNEDGTEVEAVINPVVAPCTGIFALATDESQTVTFTKNTTGEPNVTRGLLTIAISKAEGRANKQVDRAIVSFDEINVLPKFNINAGNSKLYIPQGNKNFAVVNAEAEGSLPLCFEANQRGNYTISVSTENLNVEYLHLIDNMTGADIDLLVEESYSFSSKTTDYASRFKLVFKANSTNEETNEVESSFAYISNGELIVSNEGRATLQVIDMMGRVLRSQTINGDCRISVNGMTAGVYVLNLNGKTQKIVVR